MRKAQAPLPELHPLLVALAEALSLLGSEPLDLVICGGAAMKLHGLTQRPTIDVDVVAFWPKAEGLRLARPFPPLLEEAKAQVAGLYGLPLDWLNPGPTDLLRWGLPEGCEARFTTMELGPCLRLHLMAPEDLVALKLFAYADSRSARHRQDLEALAPDLEAWRKAWRWVRQQDDSEAFLLVLRDAARRLGLQELEGA